MKNLPDPTSKRALIIGSAQGTGNLLANGLAVHGAEIVINDTTQWRAQVAADKLVAEGYRAVGYGFDVTNGEEVTRAIAQIEKEVGAIDILINNAGIQHRFPFTEFPEAKQDKAIGVNQKSVLLVLQQVSCYMVQRRRGKIANIRSMQSELGRKTITPYAASEGAVKMLTRGMCVELAEYNVQVNGIAPGYFATDMVTALVNNEVFSAWLFQRMPVARWGNPEELAGAVAYLATPASDFANGHLLFMDGGMLAAVWSITGRNVRSKR